MSLVANKYVSDKYANVPFAPIQIPKGAAFRDMAARARKVAISVMKPAASIWSKRCAMRLCNQLRS